MSQLKYLNPSKLLGGSAANCSFLRSTPALLLLGGAIGVLTIAAVYALRQNKEEEEDAAEVDNASYDSFPASDPPAWTGTHA